MINNRKQIGFTSMVLLGINAIIASGIFLLPASGFKDFGPASILVLIFDALLAISIGLCFAECASMFGESGGAYVYANKAFGHFIGYEVGLATFIIRTIAEAVIYVAFTTTLSGVFPSLNNSFAKNVIITICVVLMIFINVNGIKLTSIFNNVITVGKLLPIILLIVIGIFFIHSANFTPFFVPKLTNMGGFSNTTILLFYIFTGFEGLVITAQDMKNVKKNLPRALILSMLIITIIYILVMVVCIGILGSKLSGTSIPLQMAFTKIVGKWGGVLVLIGLLISLFGSISASTFITPRSMVALSDHGSLPKIFSKMNRKNEPYVAIIASNIIALLIAFSGTYTELVKISVVARFAQYIPTCLAVIVFRKTMPHAKRNFKLAFGYTIPIIALVVSAWLLIKTDVSELICGLGALVIAAPFYLLTKTYRNAQK
ncbi:amino acid permease [Philodulcilactobacillus myokoensis]|uniref:Amino acid permease n=1 Tax=Philodulcilactobacillus myokoensis TaxID=2929573 RepID=A0A9W6ET22_9LACO|nr:APC family permease [Philodulcilactobacillus myokoensis]GLB47631.1 amino acid permease [Philodulcilactobacillus myokoensis]